MERWQGAVVGRLSRRPRYAAGQARPAAARPGRAGIFVIGCAAAAERRQDLKDGRIIAVPGEHGRSPAIRPPRFGELAKLLLARLFGKAHQPSELDEHGKVTGGEHVASSFGEKEVDFR